MDEEFSVLAPKHKNAHAPKKEPADNSPAKPVTSGSSKGTLLTSKSTTGKRKSNGDDAKTSISALPQKKIKIENELKGTVKEESAPAAKSSTAPKGASSPSKAGSTQSTGPVSEEDIRAVLLQNGPVSTQELVSRFKSKLKSQLSGAGQGSFCRYSEENF